MQVKKISNLASGAQQILSEMEKGNDPPLIITRAAFAPRRTKKSERSRSHCEKSLLMLAELAYMQGSRCSKCLETINTSSIVFPNRDYGWICSQMGLHRGSDLALRKNGGLRAARFFRKRRLGATCTDVRL